jgi:UDP-N-acetylmuramyl pentapeptide phosphotransferase/UDP-N-acetylglucosamine-1-phosphate transferase
MPATLGLGGWLALHFLLVLAGTWWVRRYALRTKLLDHPGERRSHKTATPRGGGLAIVIAMLAALSWLAVASADQWVMFTTTAIGLVLVASVGWADDHRPLSVSARLIAHLVAGLLVAGAVAASGHGAWAALLAAVIVPVLINVWNFMDGIDGLAASQAAIAAAAFALASADASTSALSWALAAACCGFLPFNFPRARIFLGDVGSGALGYLLAVLLVWLAIQPRQGLSGVALLVLPVSAFLVDASLTLSRRIVDRERWWTAHVQHAYQQLAFRIDLHWPVTVAYGAWSLLAGALLLLAMNQAFAIRLSIATGWLVASSLAWFALQGVRGPPSQQQGSPR